MKKISILGWYEDELTAEQFNSILMLNNIICVREDTKRLAVGISAGSKVNPLIKFTATHENMLAPHVITGEYNNE